MMKCHKGLSLQMACKPMLRETQKATIKWVARAWRTNPLLLIPLRRCSDQGLLRLSSSLCSCRGSQQQRVIICAPYKGVYLGH